MTNENEEAIKTLTRLKQYQWTSDIPAFETAIEALKDRPTGHWIPDYAQLKCSECGYLHDVGLHNTAARNYCPKCGAKMEIEEGDTE